ncbi:hypothetical protein BN1723_010290, partial [Verticillium longisporum]
RFFTSTLARLVFSWVTPLGNSTSSSTASALTVVPTPTALRSATLALSRPSSPKPAVASMFLAPSSSTW